MPTGSSYRLGLFPLDMHKNTMATKIILGKRPKTFKPFTVNFTGPDGEELSIPNVVFRYRTRSEYAAMVDAANAAGSEAYKPEAGERFSLEKYLAGIARNTVGLLLDSIESWGLDEELCEAVITQLLDESPAATAALNDAYAAAARDGRLGN